MDDCLRIIRAVCRKRYGENWEDVAQSATAIMLVVHQRLGVDWDDRRWTWRAIRFAAGGRCPSRPRNRRNQRFGIPSVFEFPPTLDDLIAGRDRRIVRLPQYIDAQTSSLRLRRLADECEGVPTQAAIDYAGVHGLYAESGTEDDDCEPRDVELNPPVLSEIERQIWDAVSRQTVGRKVYLSLAGLKPLHRPNMSLAERLFLQSAIPPAYSGLREGTNRKLTAIIDDSDSPLTIAIRQAAREILAVPAPVNFTVGCLPRRTVQPATPSPLSLALWGAVDCLRANRRPLCVASDTLHWSK